MRPSRLGVPTYVLIEAPIEVPKPSVGGLADAPQAGPMGEVHGASRTGTTWCRCIGVFTLALGLRRTSPKPCT